MLHIQQSVGQGFQGDKVQRLADHINLKCREYFLSYDHIAVDKSTIGFKGEECHGNVTIPTSLQNGGTESILCVTAPLVI